PGNKEIFGQVAFLNRRSIGIRPAQRFFRQLLKPPQQNSYPRSLISVIMRVISRWNLMPSFKPTDLWNAEPHTLAKIEIVRRYLYLWFRILGTRSNRLTYIDGFSGPGRYLNSEQ